MRNSLAAGLLLLTLACDETLDRSSTKQPVPLKQSTEDSGRVTISGSSTGSEGESIKLTANVANAGGSLDYDWSLDGRGSLVSRQSDPKHATVIASSSGTLFVNVTVSEDGVEIGRASLTLRITD
jgi:hypothetical protein